MTLPAEIKPDPGYGLATSMAPGLALLFNDRLYERCKDVARIMANARGFTPAHLIGATEACFGVVQMAITWRLTPQLVAASTYQTPGGRIGYEGKLIQAILENSGYLAGGVQFELFGDWSKVTGKFKEATSNKGNKYPSPDWKPADEEGLGVTVSAHVRGEVEPRTMTMLLTECYPRNSTLWAVRPSQQIKYTAARAFASTVMPGIFMGVPIGDSLDDMVDVTPAAMQPRRADFEAREASTVTEVSEQPQADEGATEAAYGPPEALERGREDRRRGRHMRAVPPEFREPGHEALAEAWLEGWESEDEAIALAKGGKA